jgi:CheY-like chemotaxis protein
MTPLRLLVVEDDLASLELMVEVFRSLKAEVHPVRDSEKAVGRTQQNIRTRVPCPAGSERELAMLSSCARCSGLNSNAAFGRPLAVDTSIVHQRRLFSLQY